jgi:hypothetical protein
VSRSNCQPGDARDSIDAQVLCFVVAGYKERRWSSFSNGAYPEEGQGEVTEAEKELEEAQFDQVTFMVLGKSVVTAGAYERLRVAEGAPWKDYFDGMIEMSIMVV